MLFRSSFLFLFYSYFLFLPFILSLGATAKPGSAKKGTIPVTATNAPTVADFPPFDDSSTILVDRWVIQPFSSVQMKIRFRSEKGGKSEASLGFEVVGTAQTIILPCQVEI